MNLRIPLARGPRGWQYISLPRGPVRAGRAAAGTLRTGYRGEAEDITSAPRDREEHHLPDEIQSGVGSRTYDSAQVETRTMDPIRRQPRRAGSTAPIWTETGTTVPAGILDGEFDPGSG